MKKNPVVIPLQTYTELEINCVSKLRDLQNIPQTCGHFYVDRDDGVVCWVEGDRRNQLIVTPLKNQERAIILIRLIPALDYLVTPLSHAEHTHHVSDWQRRNQMEKKYFHRTIQSSSF